MTEKMTRREALETALEIMREYVGDNSGFETLHTETAMVVLENMIAQIDKQSARPKGKTSARIQNEGYAKQMIRLLMQNDKPVNATWIAEHVRGVMTSQRGVHVAKIAIEWGAVEEIMIKKRKYYQLVPGWHPTN